MWERPHIKRADDRDARARGIASNPHAPHVQAFQPRLTLFAIARKNKTPSQQVAAIDACIGERVAAKRIA